MSFDRKNGSVYFAVVAQILMSANISINSGLLITLNAIMFESLNVRYSVPIKQIPQKKAKTKVHFPISFWYARKIETISMVKGCNPCK